MRATQALFKRYRKLTLTTKDAGKGFYKGTRSGAMGRHTKFGGYVIDWDRVRTYVVPPGMSTAENDFTLTPFVTRRMPPTHGDYSGYKGGPRSGKLYLERWKAENGLS